MKLWRATMLKNVLIIANPGSGVGEAPEHAQTLSDFLSKNYKSKINLRETTKVGDAKEWAQSAKSEGYDAVICLGGDGTVNEVINGLMLVENPPVFSFVPIGTANDLGRVLGFDMNPSEAIHQFKNLELDVLDIGQVNQQYFMDAVAIGEIPTAIMETDYEKKNRLGYLAYVTDAAKAIMANEEKAYEVINSKGEIYQLSTKLIVIAMNSSLAGIEHLISHRKHNDGLMQIFALKGNVVMSGVETLATEAGISEENVNDKKLMSFSDTEVSIHLAKGEDHEKVFSNVDGDRGPQLPLEIKVHKEALQVLRPSSQSDEHL